jgi:Flp pilus assembly protein TadD
VAAAGPRFLQLAQRGLVVPVRAAVLLALLGCAHSQTAPQARPAPDQDAIREATDSFQPQRYVSARAYRHYLDALLARGADDYATAAAELREALLYDPESPHLHTVLAEVLLKQGRVADAEEELRGAIALDATHAPADLLLARIAVARDRPIEARNYLRAAIEAEPEDPDAYRELVRLELSAGDLSTAESIAARLSEATREAQRRADEESEELRGSTLWIAARLREQASAAWVDVARAHAQRHEDPAAERAFSQARAAMPSDPEALAAQAAFFEARRRIPEARALQLRLLAQRPEAPEVLAALARLALEEGDLDTVGAHARKLLGLAADMEPWDGTTTDREEERRDVAGALLRVAIPLLGAHRSADAQAAVEGALRLYPEHPELSFYRALALAQRGHAREAAAGFDQIEKKMVAHKGEPPTPAFLGVEADALLLDVRVQSALARGRAGDSPEAMRRLRALLSEHPVDEGVSLALLEAYDRAGRALEAEPIIAAAVRAHPGSEALLYALGNAQDRAGLKQKAIATMRKVLAVQPHHAGALNYVGYSLAENGESLDEAEKLLSRAVELRPDDGAIADSYGFCLLKLGRAADALVELRRADRLAPNDPIILSHLGDALLATGHREEALAAFRRALARLAPPAHRPERKPPQEISAADPPDRLPEPGDAKVRAELLEKVRALQSP